MKFISTRGQTEPHSFSQAVAVGLAPDGGLFLPEELPDLSSRLRGWRNAGYAELCTEFLRLFATDIPEDKLERMVRRSYGTFSHPDIAPLQRLDDHVHVLELFHGPTLAFKDFALQLLGNLYEYQCTTRGQGINVLGATSGDTGAAAIHGLLGKPNTAIFILYPDGRVSPLQERQMTCTGAANVHAIAIDGSFDDAQRILKEAFGDKAFAAQHRLSAVTSINLARILAQCVYYLHAWFQLPESSRDNVEFVVPTGNFGNVLAGWLLTRMQVPIRGFRIATNQNDILHRLFSTGEYQVEAVRPSHAPSMDIQVASNFERFLYYAAGEDPAQVRLVMQNIQKTGSHYFSKLDRDIFSTSRADDADIMHLIRHVRQRYNYVVDPHTACAFQSLNPDLTSVVLSTAHPAKFPEVMRQALEYEPTHPSLEALKARPVIKYHLPADVEAVKRFVAEHAV